MLKRCENIVLQKSGSPYLLNQTLTIEKGIDFAIENGVEIRLDTGVNILVHGSLFASGAKESSVVFCPKQKLQNL